MNTKEALILTVSAPILDVLFCFVFLAALGVPVVALTAEATKRLSHPQIWVVLAGLLAIFIC